jgi:hypothetical protein
VKAVDPDDAKFDLIDECRNGTLIRSGASGGGATSGNAGSAVAAGIPKDAAAFGQPDERGTT